MKHTLSVLVENKPGVLARVSSMFAQRGFNIHSLAVGPTHHEDLSRITLVVDAPDLEQLSKQLNKLVNVIKVQELEREESLEREIMLVRVAVTPSNRREVTEAAELFNSEAVDIGVNSITFQVSGDPETLHAFLDVMGPYGVSDLVKSGRIAMRRDTKTRALRAAG